MVAKTLKTFPKKPQLQVGTHRTETSLRRLEHGIAFKSASVALSKSHPNRSVPSLLDGKPVFKDLALQTVAPLRKKRCPQGFLGPCTDRIKKVGISFPAACLPWACRACKSVRGFERQERHQMVVLNCATCRNMFGFEHVCVQYHCPTFTKAHRPSRGHPVQD